MKKITILVFVIVVMLIYAGCNSDTNIDSITGTWKAYGVKIDGEIQSAEEQYIKNDIDEYYMTIKDNKVRVFVNGRMELEGTYEKNSTSYVITFEDEKDKHYIVLEDNYLIFDDGNETGDMVWVKK